MFWHKISLELVSFLVILKFLVWLILTSPSLLSQSQLQVIVTWHLWRLCLQCNLVFGQSRNKKRKHRNVSVGNCTAVCFIVICNMFLSSQRVIQLTALEDWSVSEKQQWDSAVKFMESTLQDELDKGIQQRKDHTSLLSDFLTMCSVIGSKKIVQHITNHSKLAFFRSIRDKTFRVISRAWFWLHGLFIIEPNIPKISVKMEMVTAVLARPTGKCSK